jgi:hypothetical protein
MLGLVALGSDAVSKGRQASVDVLSLLETLPSGMALVQPLTASQINQPDLGRALLALHQAGNIQYLLCQADV